MIEKDRKIKFNKEKGIKKLGKACNIKIKTLIY
jgi:hypothetical protein